MAKIRNVFDPDYQNIEEKLDPFEVVESKVKIAENSKEWKEHAKIHKDARLHVLNAPELHERQEAKKDQKNELVRGWESQTAKSDLSKKFAEQAHISEHKALNLGCSCGANFKMDPATNLISRTKDDGKPPLGYDVGNKQKDEYQGQKQQKNEYISNQDTSDNSGKGYTP